MNRRSWIGFGLLVLLIGILVALRGTASSDSDVHSSGSDGPNGTSVLLNFAKTLGHSTSTVEGQFSLPSSHALLFVFTPSADYGYSLPEAQQLAQWIAAGNVVVYAAENGDPDLDSQFNLQRATSTVNASATAAAPLFGGVTRLSGGVGARFFVPTASQVPILRNAQGDVLGVWSAIGSGVLIALTDPHVLCNGYLTLASNGRFAADLLAMTPANGSVLFDEFHHGAVASASPAVAWIGTGWGAALLLAALVVLTGLALRGRAFGPTVSLQPATDRSTGEYAMAVGSLLHRTGARNVTLATLLTATRRSVAERVGLASDAPANQLDEALAQWAPAAAHELRAVESAIATRASTEQDVLSVARRLHGLAFPPSSSAKGEDA